MTTAPDALGDVSRFFARRALDLVHDSGVSLADGVDHLRRLAEDRPGVLEDALGELQHTLSATPDVECAQLLLRTALLSLSPAGIGPRDVESFPGVAVDGGSTEVGSCRPHPSSSILAPSSRRAGRH